MPGLTVIAGPNGAGKTNLLEAVHLGTQGFSPRTRRETRAVRFGAAAARIALRGERSPGRPFETEVLLDSAGGKRIRLDGAALASADELRHEFPVLVFTPDRLAVVKGGPIVRRTYLDRVLGRLFPARARLPAEYARALAQRNAALRRIQARVSARGALSPWDEALASLGTALDAARGEVAAALFPRFREHAAALGLPGGAVSYSVRTLTVEELADRVDRDLERGATGTGPHLRDVGIAAGDRDLRLFGSQGEQRVAVLALVLAEADLLLELLGDPPLLLLDDVMSELDDSRRAALLESIPSPCQTLVTTTSTRLLPRGSREPALVVDVAPGRAAPA